MAFPSTVSSLRGHSMRRKRQSLRALTELGGPPALEGSIAILLPL